MRYQFTPEQRLTAFWAKVDKNGPIPQHMPELGNCWLWTGYKLKDGYGRFWDRGKLLLAHRFAYGDSEVFVLHHCDNPSCVRRSHLFEGTTTDNMHDMRAKMRHMYSERSPRAKLTREQVVEIRGMAGSARNVGRLFGVSGAEIARIRNGTRWTI